MISPDQLFDHAAARFPRRRIGVLAIFGLGLSFWVLATVAILSWQAWIAVGLLVLCWLGYGLLEAFLRQEGRPGRPPLGMLLPAFGFAIADPTRALAAMFLMFGLACWAMMGRAHQGWIVLLATCGYLGALLLPHYFSLFAYLIGVMAIVTAGEGAVRR